MPYYVGYKVGNQDIGLDPNGFNQGMTGPICYYHVSDIRKTYKVSLRVKVHKKCKMLKMWVVVS